MSCGISRAASPIFQRKPGVSEGTKQWWGEQPSFHSAEPLFPNYNIYNIDRSCFIFCQSIWRFGGRGGGTERSTRWGDACEQVGLDSVPCGAIHSCGRCVPGAVPGPVRRAAVWRQSGPVSPESCSPEVVGGRREKWRESRKPRRAAGGGPSSRGSLVERGIGGDGLSLALGLGRR